MLGDPMNISTMSTGDFFRWPAKSENKSYVHESLGSIWKLIAGNGLIQQTTKPTMENLKGRILDRNPLYLSEKAVCTSTEATTAIPF